MTNFINLTPHPLTFRAEDGTEQTIVPSGTVARVTATPAAVEGVLNGIPLYGTAVFGEVEDLPEPALDTIFIVSGLVGGRVTGRDDVVVPGTGPKDGPIRNEAGHIIAVTRLNRAG
jgi:hypothetical protein